MGNRMAVPDIPVAFTAFRLGDTSLYDYIITASLFSA